MKKYALLGKDIAYSRSPVIHSHIYRRMNYSASYELISASEHELATLVPRLLADYDGFNVTKPHKQAVAKFLQGSPPDSVNTVVVRGGKGYGYSTDAYGFTRDLRIRFGEVSGSALVLGAGGAAAVIVPALVEMGLDVYVHNRTRERAEALAKKANARAVEIDEIAPDLVVNCTSYGFKRGENPAFHGEKAVVTDRVKWAYDTIYSPTETDFMRYFTGAATANGYGMLILQAIEADRIMCGFEINGALERELYQEIMQILGGIK